MRAQSIHVEVGDAAHRRRERPYDRVLVDPPCSGLGTLQSRPDLRWRASPDAIVELAGLQRRILDAAGEVTAPGGALVYSVCTISRAEGPDVIDGYLREHPEFAAEDAAPLAGREHPEFAGEDAAPLAGRERSERRYLQLLPHRDRTDGFFVARLRRR